MKDTTGTRLGRFDNLYRSLVRDPFRGDDGRRTSDVEVPSTWDRLSKWLSRQITAGGICVPIVLLGGYTSRKFTTAFTCSMARAVTLGVCVAAMHHRAAAG